MHQIKSVVDFSHRQRMCDELIDLQMTREIFFHQLRHTVSALPTCHSQQKVWLGGVVVRPWIIDSEVVSLSPTRTNVE